MPTKTLLRVANDARLPKRPRARSFLKSYELGFCQLCWRQSEEQAAVYSGLKRDKLYAHLLMEVERPPLSPRIKNKAKELFEEILAAHNRKGPEDPFLLPRLLSPYVAALDYRILRDYGIGSREVEEMLLGVIEEQLRDDEFAAAAEIVGKKPPNADPVRFRNEVALAGKTPIPGDQPPPRTLSSCLCEEHNPRRSLESRRRYRNDLRRKAAFDETLCQVRWVWLNVLKRGIYTDDDRTEVRKQAYEWVSMSTLEKIKHLQENGYGNQTKIALRLGLTRKAVSLSLARERQRHKK